MSKIKELMSKVKNLKGSVKGGIADVVKELEDKILEVAAFAGVSEGELLKEDKKVVEAAPIGSFDYIYEKIYNAITSTIGFDPDSDGDDDRWNCSIVALFPDRVVISCGDGYYEMTYDIATAGTVTFGDPTQVEQYFTATENAAYKIKGESKLEKEIKECGFERVKEAIDMDFETGFASARIKENSYSQETGEVDVVIIERGTNELKKRHYPDSTIREAAPIFKGMKMYINHQTAKEEQERPERDLKDWAATIMESHYENGCAVGRVYIHDNWLRENMADPVFRANVGLSINTGGKISYGKINGQEMQIVEKINPSRSNGSGSVDWVTEAGARGRVTRLLKESATKTGEEEMKTLKEASAEDLQKENPELFKKIQESGKVAPAADEKLAEANARIASLEKENKLGRQKEKVVSLLQEAKTLPEATKIRIQESLQETVFESDEKLKEAVTAKIASELAYINSLPGARGKINIVAGGTGDPTKDIKESIQKNLETRFGLDKKEKEVENND